MTKAVLNYGQTIYAVNDLYIGQRTHVSSRYQIELGGRRERQSSSGIIISTGLGSTGWLKSVLVEAENIVRSRGQNNHCRKEGVFSCIRFFRHI